MIALFLAWDVLFKWKTRGAFLGEDHIPGRILFPALENLELQFIKKSQNLRCSCIEQMTPPPPAPSKKTQRLVTQNSPSSDNWNHAFRNKSPGAFCLTYLWSFPLVSALPFNSICLVCCLPLSAIGWYFALFLAFASKHTAPEETLALGFAVDLPMFLTLTSLLWSRAFWQPHLGSYLSCPCRGVRMSQGIINQGPHPDISSLEALGALSASGGLGRPHPAAFIHRPFPEQWADWWQNGELNIYVWKTRKAQKERSLSARACWRNIIRISTVVSLNNAHFLSWLLTCKENHPNVTSVLVCHIILGTWAASPSKELQKTWDLFLFL